MNKITIYFFSLAAEPEPLKFLQFEEFEPFLLLDNQFLCDINKEPASLWI